MKKTKITQFVNKKTLQKKLKKIVKWLDKPTKLKKWQLLLIVYLVFSFLHIFWPHPSSRALPSIILHSETIKPVEALKMPEMKQIDTVSMVNYPYMPAGTYTSDYAFGNCTSLAASMVKVPNSLGNANMWDDQAPVRTSVPMVGMVAQTDAGWAGHVAVVIAVGDGTVTVEEMNYDGFNMIDTRTTPVSDWVYLAF